MAGLPKEIFVVVAENGGNNCPIAFETECLDLDSAKIFQKRIGSKYGKTAIYKAVKLKEIK